jgi:imidazolonepropionase-like amidohydrolase
MKVLSVLSILLWICLPNRAQTGIIAIRNATVIDVKNGKLIKNQTILIEGNKITSVSSKSVVPKSATAVDAKGKYILPGLWDMHAHSFTDRRFEWLFPLLIANGVTGVRDLATALSFDSIQLVKNQVMEGKLLGPRFGAVTHKVINAAVNPNYPSIAAANANDARELVRLYKQQGMDFIKPYNQLSREVLLGIMDEAKLQGISVGGHVPYAISAAEASDLGFVSIEHNIDILVSCSGDETRLRQILDTLPRNLAQQLRQEWKWNLVQYKLLMRIKPQHYSNVLFAMERRCAPHS